MMDWKGFGRKRSWPNFNAVSWNLPEGTEENHKNSISIAGRRGREYNLGPPE
jgi:hypothetical protein